ncbi:gamma-glutamylcyclotransferase [Vibrio sp. S4M6]|uniref:gamma-glutamylcyclotransferase family protein n=1 Tax=Vibrio sinus TaxID=2946865 RepID=UPI00202A528C|nr:gamma-glutamylcyclotransferase family protein [Vibrio sinus]MCL9781411.1 gamma-glutamylcyclotransferase [Vibrio sinus]
MYIFGYGSLMNSESRKRTGQTGTAIPVFAHGLVRHWGKLQHSTIMAPLIVSQGHGKVNGVLIEVDDNELPSFDERESGYDRIQLLPENIETDHEFNHNAPIWVYVREDHQPPCQLIPIMQSYVDTVIAGCLEISELFAEQFIQHTLGWHFPIEDDRLAPKYGNLAGVQSHHRVLIDELLTKAS